jgi:hypothetical protein
VKCGDEVGRGQGVVNLNERRETRLSPSPPPYLPYKMHASHTVSFLVLAYSSYKQRIWQKG